MDDCIFCKIAKGEIPCYKVYGDDGFLAFLDINPASKGHTLVIPKEHYKDIGDIPEEVLSNGIKIIRKIARGLLKEYEGVNIVQNNGSAAGQLVMHVHFHVIPRKEGDKKVLQFTGAEKYEEGEAEKVLEKIKSNLE